MRYILVRVIDFYRLFLSPLAPCVCRFQPSCSRYAREAVQAHGPVKGLLLAVCRLLRCNPLFRPGHDPVPESFALKYLAGIKIRKAGSVSVPPDQNSIRSQHT